MKPGLRSWRARLDPRSLPCDWHTAWVVADGRERFYWSHPATGTTIFAVGAVHVIEAAGADRFDSVSRAVRTVFEGLDIEGDAGPACRGPLLVGGFAFSGRLPGEGFAGFPPARLVLPELLLVEREGELWLTLTGASADARAVRERQAPVLDALFRNRALRATDPEPSGFEREGAAGLEPGPEYRVRADRSHADYRAQVEAARREIASGRFEKVVLARSLRVRHDEGFDRVALLERLEGLYPECVTFAVAPAAVPDSPASGSACFVGATPELLVARQGDRIQSSAVAGSAARGRSPEEDARLARELRESKKEQEEHAVVVRTIAEGMRSLCGRVSHPEAPSLLRLEGIQHLHTPIEGRLEGAGQGPSVIDLAGRLHPTPAVGGAPREPALEWIERCEGLDRGWYAGPLGFVDREGGGELRVALRCGLLRSRADGDEARLFAGGGLVADSTPERELEETRVKLRALLAPLTAI